MEEISRLEIMRGHLEECVYNFNGKLANLARKSAQKQKIMVSMASFCGVSIDTARRWLRGTEANPIAESKIKLMCYLDLLGYKVIELENMGDSLRNLAELIAFGLITTAQAIKIIGYSRPTVLYRIFYGQENTSAEKKEKIWQLIRAKKNELTQAKEKTAQNLIFLTATLLPASAAVPEPESEDTELIGTPANTFTQGLLSLLQGINVLLESEAAKNLTDQELSALPASQAGIISKLATNLAALRSRLKDLKGQTGDAHG
jgi:uncharacterized coiled-coil protein SlyX